MKTGIKWFIVGALIGALVVYLLKNTIIKEVKVPFVVEVEVPIIEKEFDTIFLEGRPIHNIVRVVDSSLVEKYRAANDSLRRELFNSAVTVREYQEVFEDSTITITVGANVTGTLNSLIAKYKTKPRVVVVDTTLTVEVPNYNRSISVYGELGLPTKVNELGTINAAPLLKAGFDITTKKNSIWGGSFDTENRVWVKYGKRFNF
jgi:hypothetical protein